MMIVTDGGCDNDILVMNLFILSELIVRGPTLVSPIPVPFQVTFLKPILTSLTRKFLYSSAIWLT